MKKIVIRKKKKSCAYSSSLIQQGYAESINKGYLVWDTDLHTFERRFIPNDFGFAKITISKGEIFEERLSHIKFSNNKKKTKIYITWEDFEENYSIEKEEQIKSFVKSKFGCEVVKVQFEGMMKNVQDVTEGIDEDEKFINIFKSYIEKGEFDYDEDLLKEIIEFAEKTEKTLEINEKESIFSKWELNSITVCNIFSFGEAPITIDFDKYKGITGFFGENYCGKTNFAKALVWGLYQEIVGGSKGDAKKLVNLYTSLNKGYVVIYITIDGEKYKIYRSVTTTVKANKELDNKYQKTFEKLIINEEGEEEWASKISDEKATEKVEVEKLVHNAIGSFDEFTKVSLQTQGGSDDYLSLKQQPKNDLINKFLGLERYRDRYAYVNKFFIDIKKKQKELGSIEEKENEVKDIEKVVKEKEGELKNNNKERNTAQGRKQKSDDKVLELTKTLQKIESAEIEDSDVLKIKIDNFKIQKNTEQIELNNLNEWLKTNFKKDLPFDENETEQKTQQDLTKEKGIFSTDKLNYTKTEIWLKTNKLQKEIKADGISEEVNIIRTELTELKNQLPLYKGEKCPTCGSITTEADPALESKCLDDIEKKTLSKEKKEKLFSDSQAILSHNINVTNQTNTIKNLKSSLKARHLVIKNLDDKLKLIKGAGEIIKHNQSVEASYKRTQFLTSSISAVDREILHYENMLKTVNSNVKAVKHNEKIDIEIENQKAQSKSYQLSVFNFGNNISDLSGDIKVEKNKLDDVKENLKNIKEFDRTYKKYSIYLQSVHRDGIPMLIIRKKLPIVSSKINRILSDLVNFKFEFIISATGDISEQFYFMEDKLDALPLSFASGSQKFVMAIAIQDGLNYVTKLTKPSIKIVDEGFGTLGTKLTSEIINTLYYLKNRYKNVLVITHKNEIKDFVDRTIEFSKTKVGIPKEIAAKMEEDGGLSKLTFY